MTLFLLCVSAQIWCVFTVRGARLVFFSVAFVCLFVCLFVYQHDNSRIVRVENSTHKSYWKQKMIAVECVRFPLPASGVRVWLRWASDVWLSRQIRHTWQIRNCQMAHVVYRPQLSIQLSYFVFYGAQYKWMPHMQTRRTYRAISATTSYRKYARYAAIEAATFSRLWKYQVTAAIRPPHSTGIVIVNTCRPTAWSERRPLYVCHICVR